MLLATICGAFLELSISTLFFFIQISLNNKFNYTTAVNLLYYYR